MLSLPNVFILGAVQGITEWLPISSQGHIALIMLSVFKTPVEEALNLSIWLHIGTLLAAVCYFRKDIREILKSPDKNRNLISFLVISTVITGMLGYFIYTFIEQNAVLITQGEYLMAGIGFLLIGTGLLQKYAKGMQHKNIQNLRANDSILLGFFQAFSAIPGISRSGITTSLLLLRDYKAKEALKLSFLMSIPVVLAAEIGLGLTKGINFDAATSIVGASTSFVFGLLSIGYLMKIAQKIKFWKFCILIGIISFVPLVLSLV